MLTVITGPMFSSKTSTLFDILDEYFYSDRRIVLFKPENDTRYTGGDVVCTHSGRKRNAYAFPRDKPSMIIGLASQLASMRRTEQYIPPDVVGIDEAQFFDADKLIEVVEKILYKSKESGFPTQPDLVISGLSQDSSGKPFGAMPHLLAIADDIIHCKSVCAVTKKRRAATRTYRKDKTNGAQVVVGGREKYEARSFKEWLKEQ